MLSHSSATIIFFTFHSFFGEGGPLTGDMPTSLLPREVHTDLCIIRNIKLKNNLQIIIVPFQLVPPKLT